MKLIFHKLKSFERKEKVVSAVVSVILLILIATILTGMILSWSKNAARDKQTLSDTELRNTSNIGCLSSNFIIESCTINYASNSINILVSNNSSIRYFNLTLTLQGKLVSGQDVNLVGVFDKPILSGELKLLSTANGFTYIKNSSSFNLSTISTITNMVLTNGTCPNQSINLLSICT